MKMARNIVKSVDQNYDGVSFYEEDKLDISSISSTNIVNITEVQL